MRDLPLLDRIIDEVSGELFRAQLYLSVAFALNEKYKEDKITSLRYFFYGSYYASLREGLLSFTKLLIPHQESISFDYLLNYAMSNPGEYGNSKPDQVKAMVRRHKDHIKSLGDLVERLKLIRDMDLAHLDKRRITHPKDLVPEPIDLTELDQALHTLLLVVNEHDAAHRSKEMHLQHIRDFTTRDLDYIVGLIDSADKPPQALSSKSGAI